MMTRIIISCITFIVLLLLSLLGIFIPIPTKNKIGRGESQCQLEREYIRYTYVKKILGKVYAATNNRYEAKNIVERWLLSMVNFSEGAFDAVFSRDIYDESCRFNTQMAHELREKFRLSATDINAIIADIINIVKKYENSA